MHTPARMHTGVQARGSCAQKRHACVHTRHCARMHAHWSICIRTHRTHSHLHAKAPCVHAHQPTCMQVCTHKTRAHVYPRHLQVCTTVCTVNPKRKLKRAAELRDRRGGGKKRRARGSWERSELSWLVGYLGGPSPGSCRIATIPSLPL